MNNKEVSAEQAVEILSKNAILAEVKEAQLPYTKAHKKRIATKIKTRKRKAKKKRTRARV